VVIAFVGVGYASPLLVYIGVTMTSAVVIAGLWMVVSVNAFLRRFPFARREVAPRPLSAGRPGKVTVKIQSGTAAHHRRFGASFTDTLDIREQAASELTGGLGTKATVARTPDSLTLTYELHPQRRGRWPLGPALVHTTDPFGMVVSDTEVGLAESIPVWPAVFDLSATAGALMGHADRVVLGARTPSADDASIRDYHEGDDMRRVHWKSTARRGEMMVRSDERAGRRPATVIMDLPRDEIALEWIISAAASIALSVLDSGHPVRLLGGGIEPDMRRRDGELVGASARATVLNSTVDLTVPISQAAGTRDTLRAAREASQVSPQGEVIVGVFNALDKQVLDALVPIGDTGRAWAIVRATDIRLDSEARSTAAALRRAGWRAALTSTGANLDTVWTTLLTAGDMD